MGSPDHTVLRLCFPVVNAYVSGTPVRMVPPKGRIASSLLRGENVDTAINSFTRMYQNERSTTMEMTIRLKTCSTKHGRSLDFLPLSFINTIENMWESRPDEMREPLTSKLILKIVYNKDLSRHEFLRRVDEVILAEDEPMLSIDSREEFIKKHHFKILVPPRGHAKRRDENPAQSVIDTFGYLPMLRIDSLKDVDTIDEEWNDIKAVVEVVFQLMDYWILRARMTLTPSIISISQLHADIIRFFSHPLFRESETIDDFVRLIKERNNILDEVECTIELVYDIENGVEDDIKLRLNNGLYHLIRNGWKRDKANLQFSKLNKAHRMDALWYHMKRVITRWNRRASAIYQRNLLACKLLYTQLTQNVYKGSMSDLANIYNTLEEHPYTISYGVRGEVVLLICHYRKISPSSPGILEIAGHSISTTYKHRIEVDDSIFLDKSDSVTIFECVQQDGRYYIYDILQLHDSVLIGVSFDERYASLFEEECENMFALLRSNDIICIVIRQLTLSKENFGHATNKIFDTRFSANGEYDTDYSGMIIRNISIGYMANSMYLFKPSEANSINMLLRRIDPMSLIGLGITPHRISDVYVCYTTLSIAAKRKGLNRMIRNNPWYHEHFPAMKQYFTYRTPVPFVVSSPLHTYLFYSDVPLEEDYDDKIYKCRWDVRDSNRGQWTILGEKEDLTLEYKTQLEVYGTYYTKARHELIAMLDSITPDVLSTFIERRSTIITIPLSLGAISSSACRSYNHFAKIRNLITSVFYEEIVTPRLTDEIMIHFENCNGLDIGRIFFAGCRHLYAIGSTSDDIIEYEIKISKYMNKILSLSRTSLANLISNVRRIPDRPTFNFTGYAHDHQEDSLTTLQNMLVVNRDIPTTGVGCLVFNETFQYYTSSPNRLVELKSFCDKILQVNGFVVALFQNVDLILKEMRRLRTICDIVEGTTLTFNHMLAGILDEPKFVIHSGEDTVTIEYPGIPGTDKVISCLNRRLIRQVFSNYTIRYSHEIINSDSFEIAFSRITKMTSTNIKDYLSLADYEMGRLYSILIMRKKRKPKGLF